MHFRVRNGRGSGASGRSRRSRAIRAKLHHPPSGQQHGPLLGFAVPDDAQFDPVRPRGLGRILAGVALADVGRFDGLAGRLLDGLGQRRDPGPLLLARGRHPQGEQVAERVDGGVDLRAVGPLMPAVAGPGGRSRAWAGWRGRRG
jgi:hypothetical protein